MLPSPSAPHTRAVDRNAGDCALIPAGGVAGHAGRPRRSGRGSSAHRVRACSARTPAPGVAVRRRPAAAARRRAADMPCTPARLTAQPVPRRSCLRPSASRPSPPSKANPPPRWAQRSDRGIPTRRWRACTLDSAAGSSLGPVRAGRRARLSRARTPAGSQRHHTAHGGERNQQDAALAAECS